MYIAHASRPIFLYRSEFQCFRSVGGYVEGLGHAELIMLFDQNKEVVNIL